MLGRWKYRLKRALRKWGLMSSCSHSKIRSDRWNAPDGCPMISSICEDCGWYDEGHVHGDSWEPDKVTCQREPSNYIIKW